MGFSNRVFGPKVPDELLKEHPNRYRLPALLFAASMLVLLVSIFFPYWVLKLSAPQFPKGLQVSAYVNRLVGQVDPVTNSNDLDQLNELNHYVGMADLRDGAQLERTLSVIGIAVLAGLLLAGTFIRSRFVLLLALPAVAYPLIFLADLQYWLWRYGNSLDPRAPLASAVGKFTPHLFGRSKIAQFDTLALPGPGLILAVLGALLSAAGLWYHRRAYRPLILAMEAATGTPGDEAAGAPPHEAGTNAPAVST